LTEAMAMIFTLLDLSIFYEWQSDWRHRYSHSIINWNLCSSNWVFRWNYDNTL